MFLGYPPNDIIEFIKSHRKLPYDAEVEYLESTGTQWIDTGIYGDDNLFTSVSCAATQNKYTRDVFGAFDTTYDSTGYSFRVRITKNATDKFSIGRNTNIPTSIAVDSVENWHSIAIDTTSGAKNIFIDGIQVDTTSPSTANKMVTKLYLFAQNNNGVVNNFADGARVSAFSVKDTTTGKMLLDLIPVRFTNELGQSEGAMYDRLGVGGMNPDGSPRTDGIYRNRGTGEFLWTDKQ